MAAIKEYTTQVVTSADGTKAGYRQMGAGKGIVLVHGGLQASQNFMQLATLLSDEFTVYIVDRRGRGLSGPFGENYSIKKDCEDLDAVLQKTGAQCVFGLSSGAVISLHTALRNAGIKKLALYEPPLSWENPPFNAAFIGRYEKEMAKGNLAAAFVTIVKGLKVSGLFFSLLPRFMIVPLFRMALAASSKEKENNVPLTALIPAFHYDNLIIDETAGPLERFDTLSTKTLLMCGSKSPVYLKKVIYKLKNILPNATQIEFKGLDHLAADDSGKPEVVAAALRDFFSK